ncbi:hypothetical protein Vretimale_12825, partial [Volvox reticuliferus]
MTDLTSLCTLLVSVPGLRCGVTSCQGIGSARTDVCTSKDSDSHASIQGIQLNFRNAVAYPGMQAAGTGQPPEAQVIQGLPDGIRTWPVWQSRQAPMSMKTRSGEANEAVSWTDDMDEDAFLLLVAAAQNQGALGPAAALYIAAVAAASVAALRCSLRISSRGQQGTAAALRRAAVWLAEVSVDALVPEPAARAAMAGLADVLTAALQVLRVVPSAVAATAVPTAVAVDAAVGSQSDVDAMDLTSILTSTAMPTATATAAAAAAAAVLYEPRCDPVRLTAAAVNALYGRCPDAAAVAAAARLLGCCLQLQIQPPPPPSRPQPSTGRIAAAERSAAAGRGAKGLVPLAVRPMGLSEAAGWGTLLDLRRHPHPLVRTACLSAVQQ